MAKEKQTAALTSESNSSEAVARATARIAARIGKAADESEVNRQSHDAADDSTEVESLRIG